MSGWYTFQGSQYRDTDWYILNTGPMGIIEITADAEAATYIFELSPQDCANVGVAQQATAGPCLETFMTIVGPANTPVWFWVGPTVFAPPPGGDPMYDYVVWFDYGIIATEGDDLGHPEGPVRVVVRTERPWRDTRGRGFFPGPAVVMGSRRPSRATAASARPRGPSRSRSRSDRVSGRRAWAG